MLQRRGGEAGDTSGAKYYTLLCGRVAKYYTLLCGCVAKYYTLLCGRHTYIPFTTATTTT